MTFSFCVILYHQALDADRDGETKMRYKILTSNSDVLSVDEHTGEVKITTPVSSSHTSRGQYELVVRAFDDGKAIHLEMVIVYFYIELF